MAKHRGPVLLDTNVILECHRVGAWPALAGGYRLETVEDCVAETQTGYQRRRPERQIDPTNLRDSFGAIHSVEDLERAELLVRAPDIALDEGEESLWAHALRRNDDWIICGPDTASLRLGVRFGFRDRLVSLEQLLKDVGRRFRTPLQGNYTEKWLAEKRAELILMEGRLID